MMNSKIKRIQKKEFIALKHDETTVRYVPVESVPVKIQVPDDYGLNFFIHKVNKNGHTYVNVCESTTGFKIVKTSVRIENKNVLLTLINNKIKNKGVNKLLLKVIQARNKFGLTPAYTNVVS